MVSTSIFLLRGEQAGLAVLQLRGLLAQRRVGLLRALHGAGAGLHQVVVAGLLLLREFQIGFGGGDVGGLLLDQRLLQGDLRIEVAHRGFGAATSAWAWSSAVLKSRSSIRASNWPALTVSLSPTSTSAI